MINKALDLVYLYENILYGKKNTGYNLSGKYKVELQEKPLVLNIKKNQQYVDSFWGENIINCFSVVGKNGSGKTRLMNTIMEIIQEMKWSILPKREFIIIFEDFETEKLHIFSTKEFLNVVIECDNVEYELHSAGQQEEQILKNYEIAYFHNAFSENDYYAKNKCRYDFSVGALIANHHSMTTEMKYDSYEKDAIKNYFDQEAFRIIDFCYQYVIRDDLKIEFPIPKWVFIGIADSRYNEEYIITEAKKLKVDKKDEYSFLNKVSTFQGYVNEIEHVFNSKWIGKTIRILLLNCFKAISIPVTSKDNRVEDCYICLEICNKGLKRIKGMDNVRGYECVLDVLEKLKAAYTDRYVLTIEDTINFLNWLRNAEEKIREYEVSWDTRLDIPTGKHTENLMYELLGFYSKLNFPFPFFAFSFGVSTGEYCFLSIFAKLYSMRNEKKQINTTYDFPLLENRTKNLLIIFDEADLTMHPKWQRWFMKWMTNFCKKMYPDIAVKIIVTTHSPILLSDFPSDSVLYLHKNQGDMYSTMGEIDTFGANIHSLFLNAFFLEQEGTMGAFAEEKINFLARMLLEETYFDSIMDEKTLKMINYIGETLIREKLIKAYYRKQGEISHIVKNESEMNNKALRRKLGQIIGLQEKIDTLVKELECELKND